jgi:hypothetical protein
MATGGTSRIGSYVSRLNKCGPTEWVGLPLINNV